MSWPTESRHARGYGAAWDKLRKTILKRDSYLCQCDRCKGGADGGRFTPANEVNHRTPKALAKRYGWSQEQIDAPGNLHAINTDCHKRVTAEQRGYTPSAVKGCDVNGWPLDPAHHWNRAAPGGPSDLAEAKGKGPRPPSSVQERQSKEERSK